MKRSAFALFAVALAAPLLAQDWKGMGRLSGRVNDADGKPIAGATVKLDCPGLGGGTTVVTDKKGSWAYQGLAACKWNIDISMDGYTPITSGAAMASEQMRIPPIDVRMAKRQGPPPELVEALKNGDAAFAAQQWADARTNYEKVASMRPDLAVQLYPRLARIYGAEKNTEKALEYLQKSIEADPTNQQMKLVAATAAMDAGMTDKALLFLGSVDDTKITNGDGYFDIAVGFLRKGDSGNAVAFFSKSIEKDPKIVEAYYWRGIAYVQQSKMAEAKADMQKVVELEPSGPNADKAKKALDQLK